MPTYEENVDAQAPPQFKAAKEPMRRRMNPFPGCWVWIDVPKDEHRDRSAAAPPATVVESVGANSTVQTQPETTTMATVRKETLYKQFEAREGTIRDKVIKVLVDQLNHPVPTKQLLKAAYGNQNEENVGALRNVLKGVNVMITSKKLPVELEHVSTEELPSGYRLHAV